MTILKKRRGWTHTNNPPDGFFFFLRQLDTYFSSSLSVEGFRVSKSISISSGLEFFSEGSRVWIMCTTRPSLSPGSLLMSRLSWRFSSYDIGLPLSVDTPPKASEEEIRSEGWYGGQLSNKENKSCSTYLSHTYPCHPLLPERRRGREELAQAEAAEVGGYF